jgi:hypothetical protein
MDQKSLDKLATCDERLQRLFTEVSKTWEFTVIEGHRGKDAQEQAYATGHTKLHWPHGKHNAEPSLAVDVIPSPVDWKDTMKITYFAGYVMATAESLGINLRWGGDWRRQHDPLHNTFNDLVHFEVVSE